jgi:hypothetical protein
MKSREIGLLGKRLGDWTVDLAAKMPDGTSLRGKGTARSTELSLERGIRTEIRLDVEGMGAYHEDDLWGFDQWDKKIHFYSITSSGAVHDHSGTWKDNKTLELHWRGLYEGKPTTEDVVITFAGDNEIRVHEVDTSDGQSGPVFDYILKKQWDLDKTAPLVQSMLIL